MLHSEEAVTVDITNGTPTLELETGLQIEQQHMLLDLELILFLLIQFNLATLPVILILNLLLHFH